LGKCAHLCRESIIWSGCCEEVGETAKKLEGKRGKEKGGRVLSEKDGRGRETKRVMKSVGKRSFRAHQIGPYRDLVKAGGVSIRELQLDLGKGAL